ncbi:MAG: hypothetical protein IT318_04975 [Anaerolineales bacterium]|nr:hypothetical protein [Anaerolineales bacterium]
MRSLDRLWNLLAVILLGLTGLSCLCFATVFVNPLGVFNAIAPLPVPELLAVPTRPPFATATEPVFFPTLPPEWTATASSTATVSPTARVTSTLVEPANTRALAPAGTRTPFPSPIGPTIIPTETDLPTRTPTASQSRPAATRTPAAYPGFATTVAPAASYP